MTGESVNKNKIRVLLLKMQLVSLNELRMILSNLFKINVKLNTISKSSLRKRK